MGNSLCRRDANTFDNPLYEFKNINDDIDKAVDLAMHSGHEYNKLMLKFACEKLPNMDYFSKTDAFLVLYEKSEFNEWVEVDRTEIVEDCLNPTFIQAVPINYYFEKDQTFKIVAFDADQFDNPRLPLKDAKYIGEGEFEIQRLAASRAKRLEVTFYDAQKIINSARGKVIITYEEAKSTFNQVLDLSLKALDPSFSQHSSYFYIISKRTNDIPARNVPVMRSEVITYGEKDNKWKQ